ncbi:MAG TPA: acyltransferase [Polyangiaceae bacterium]|nr:acyltransferase [Polyangiaceae bacterium]
MVAPHAEFLGKRRYPSLDGIRCLAIVPVVFHHSTPVPYSGFLGQGPLGVHLFFALSGFLIPSLLLAEERRSGRILLGAFWARRALRIFPLYYAVLALYVARALLFLPDSPMRSDFLRDVPYFATYTGNVLANVDVPHPVIFAFSWSLATEAQFYLLFPPLLVLCRSFAARAALVLALLVLDRLAECGSLAPLVGDGVFHRVVTSISTPMCLGALAALALGEGRAFRALVSLLGGRHVATALLVAMLGEVWLAAPLFAVHVTMAAFVVALALRDDSSLAPALEHPLVRHVGKVSYGIYLLHVAAITAVKWALPGALRGVPAVVFPLALLLSVAVATLSYRYFETWFLSRRGTRPTSGRAVPGLAG